MATGDRFVNIANKRLMGLTDFRERLLDHLKKVVRDVHQTAYGLDGVFGGTPITLSAFSADRFQLSANHPMCSDGAGNFLKTNTQLAGRDVGLAFENANGVTYHVGLHYAERPRDVQINPRTGYPEFVAWEETIGERAEPNSVTDNGDGTLTFRIDSVCEPFGGTVRTHVNRKCLVWKKSPGRLGISEALAIEELTVAFTSGQNRITTTTRLGQEASNTSTNASDYFVLLLGPTVSRGTDLSAQAGYTYVGTVTGAGTGIAPSSFDTSGQHDLSSGFAVDLNEITRLVNGDLKVRVRAVVADTEEAQLEVQNAGGSTVFKVDEDGDTTTHNVTATGDAAVQGAASFEGNTEIGSAEADAHQLRGSLAQLSDADAVVAELTEAGELGLGGEAEAGFALKTHAKVKIGGAQTDAHILKGNFQLITDAVALVFEILGASGRVGAGGAASTTPGRNLKVTNDVEWTRTAYPGTGLASGAANAEIPRSDYGAVNGDALFNHISSFTIGTAKVHLYVRTDKPTFVVAVNCHYATSGGDANKWVIEGYAGTPAKLEFSPGTGLTLFGMYEPGGAPLDENPWADNAWNTSYTFPLPLDLAAFDTLRATLPITVQAPAFVFPDSAPRTVTKGISPASAFLSGPGAVGTGLSADGALVGGVTPGAWSWTFALELPHGAKIIAGASASVWMKNANGTGQTKLKFFRLSRANPPVRTELGSIVDVPGTGSNWQAVSFTFSAGAALTIDNETYSYAMEVSGTNDEVPMLQGGRMTFTIAEALAQ